MEIHRQKFLIAQFPGVDNYFSHVTFASSTVERVGENKTLPVRSRPSDRSAEATRRTARPEKTDWFCEEQLGSGTAKAVITSGVVTVHASTQLAPSQELAARA